jgi:hypothetical protein
MSKEQQENTKIQEHSSFSEELRDFGVKKWDANTRISMLLGRLLCIYFAYSSI